jgi:N-acetylglucosaminyldiphosphoundecaprenol N-acetyl-beta-D-mannosaminyltransferase
MSDAREDGGGARPARIMIGRVPVDVLTFDDALERIDALVEKREGGYVVTPNVDHVVLAEQNPRFLKAYVDASLSLVDGFPLLVTARLMKTPLPEKISGSDLTGPLMELAAKRGRSVYLFGAGPGVAEVAAKKLVERIPGLKIAGTDSPMIDVNAPADARREPIEKLKAARPDLVLMALGAPKQEILMHLIRDEVKPAVMLGIGATLDFIAGTVKRAPKWMSRVGLEWAFRMSQEPKRMFERYVIRDSKYPGIVIRHALARKLS